jgi:hypothetical protein
VLKCSSIYFEGPSDTSCSWAGLFCFNSVASMKNNDVFPIKRLGSASLLLFIICHMPLSLARSTTTAAFSPPPGQDKPRSTAGAGSRSQVDCPKRDQTLLGEERKVSPIPFGKETSSPKELTPADRPRQVPAWQPPLSVPGEPLSTSAPEKALMSGEHDCQE